MREALRVVGEHLVGVAEPAGGLGHDLDRVDAVAPVGVRVEVAAEVRSRDQGRQAALVAGLDLAPVLAQLGLDVRQPEEAVRAGLVLERPELGGVALEWPAVLVDPEIALLAQRPAAITGDPAEPDVVVRGPGEVDEVRPGLAGRHDHQVDLRAAEDRDRRLRGAGAEDLVDDAQVGEPVDDRRRVRGLDEQVEVADRLAAAAERSRLDDPRHAGDAAQLLDEVVARRLRPVDQHPGGRASRASRCPRRSAPPCSPRCPSASGAGPPGRPA